MSNCSIQAQDEGVVGIVAAKTTIIGEVNAMALIAVWRME